MLPSGIAALSLEITVIAPGNLPVPTFENCLFRPSFALPWVGQYTDVPEGVSCPVIPLDLGV